MEQEFSREYITKDKAAHNIGLSASLASAGLAE
jgi:hypothetical protein